MSTWKPYVLTVEPGLRFAIHPDGKVYRLSRRGHRRVKDLALIERITRLAAMRAAN